jgi:hypothetical protein
MIGNARYDATYFIPAIELSSSRLGSQKNNSTIKAHNNKPKSTSVLGGGGSNVFKQAGNKWLRKTIVKLLEIYNSMDSQEKCCIIRNISH